MKRLISLICILLLIPTFCFSEEYPRADDIIDRALEYNDADLEWTIGYVESILDDLYEIQESRVSVEDTKTILQPGDVLFDDGQIKVTFEEFIIKYPVLYLRCLYENNSDALLRIEAKHFTINGWDAITYHGLGDDTAIITSHTKAYYNLKFHKGASSTYIKTVDDIEYFDCNFEVSGEHYTKLFDFFDEPTRFYMK